MGTFPVKWKQNGIVGWLPRDGAINTKVSWEILQSESWSWPVREGEDWAEDTVGESLKASWQEAHDHQAHQEL